MSLYNHLHKTVLHCKDSLKRTGIYNLLSQLQQEQFLSRGELQTLQNQRLQLLLGQASSHSKYYRELFENNNIQVSSTFGEEDLKSIPLLTREILQKNVDKILCANAEQPRKNATGGSTGSPVIFYQDEKYGQISEALHLLFLDWIGINSGDKTAIFWGADRDLGELSFKEKLRNLFDRVKQLNSFSMTDEIIDNFLTGLNQFQPRYIFGYASSLYHIARHVNQTKQLSFSPVAIRSSAEMLYDYQREEIEKAFNAPVYNFYGSREVNNLAAECPAHEGLHLLESWRLVEIVDDNGEPLPDGQPGHIVVTDLSNFSFPFIRYLNGDMATIRREKCSCGRTYQLIDKIHGRSTDMIEVNGQQIHGEYFTHLFYDRLGIKQFQLIQETEQHLVLKVVTTTSEIVLDDIREAIIGKCGQSVKLDIEIVDNIPTTSTGKHRFTISKLQSK